MTRTLLVCAGLTLLGGCGNPMNLGYDFGRAFTASFQTQADLTRPSVAAAQYRMTGIEGTMIRLRLETEAGDAESERSTLGN
ncbi:MAG: hypothetical protein AB8H79_17080 [Myxococcota bacterium]